MIITITGKPCSGKGTVSKLICKQHDFEYVCTGDMFREFAHQYGFDDILKFQQSMNTIEIDHLVDNKTAEIGKTRTNENILIDSRLAWHFVPNSFKVFIDVSWEIAGERLLEAKRSNEKVKTKDEAIEALKQRWQVENERYSKIYGTNNLNPSNYNFVISSDNKTPEELAQEIFEAYEKFMQKA